MKVSIITAVLNGAQSIARTLESVADQDHEDIEHLIADGGSSDGTLDIVEAGRGAGRRVISGRDRGVYDAFNKGLNAVSGEVIAFLNSGDTYESCAVVREALSALETFKVDATFADALIVKADRPSEVIRRYSSKWFRPAAMCYGFMPAHPTLFLRRKVYLEAGEYDPGFRIAGDFEFCLRAFVRRGTTYRYVSKPWVRMPAGGLSNRGWRSKLEITKEMRQACKMNGVATNWAKLCLRLPLKLAEMT